MASEKYHSPARRATGVFTAASGDGKRAWQTARGNARTERGRGSASEICLVTGISLRCAAAARLRFLP
ncbi:MAG TPA: hypothetical protein VGB76_19695 [Pyrinomonadaceae bacterium]